MSWASRIIEDIELRPFWRDLGANELSSRVEALLNHQKANWPLLREGTQNLSQVVTRRIPLGRFEILAQFNPQRLTSAAAPVDRESVRNRPCFLCAENLPPEEKGLAYGEAFVILPNPAPILDRHLSIVHRQHIEQAIADHFEVMLDLAKDLSPAYFVLYNGPQCGASAPDHLHFQACTREGLLIERHLEAIETDPGLSVHRHEVVTTTEIELLALEDYHLSVLIYRGSHRKMLAGWFYETLKILADLTGKQPEPLINVVVCAGDRSGHIFSKDRGWTVYLFPRAQHRPSCYYAEGEDKLMVSPGALDLVGCLVVPVEEHFRKVGPEVARQIFSEVTLGEPLFSHLVRKLKERTLGLLAEA